MFTPLEKREVVLKKSDELVEEMLRCSTESDCKYVDAEFPASRESFGRVKRKNEFGELIEPFAGRVYWRRPEHFLHLKTTGDEPENAEEVGRTKGRHVTEGFLRDCWLTAPLKALAGVDEFWDQILPDNVAAAKAGMHQVVLYVDGRWKVLLIDDFFPCNWSNEKVFAYTCHTQLFTAVVEKAMAKQMGSYADLDGKYTPYAFETLTGAYTKVLRNRPLDDDLDEVWDELVRAKAAGFPMTFKTAAETEKNKDLYTHNVLLPDHAYPLVDVHTNCGRRWLTVSQRRKYLDVEASIYVELACPSFRPLFEHISICHYHPNFLNKRIEQTATSEEEWDESKVLMITVHKSCQVAVEAVTKRSQAFCKEFLVNVHRATPNNRLGEVVQSAIADDSATQTELSLLEKGTYFVVFHNLDEKTEFPTKPFTVVWSVLSSSPVHFGFTSKYKNLGCESLQLMIEKMGVVEEPTSSGDTDHVTVTTWRSRNTAMVMATNRAAKKCAEVKVSHWNCDQIIDVTTTPDVGAMASQIVHRMRSTVWDLRTLGLTIKVLEGREEVLARSNEVVESYIRECVLKETKFSDPDFPATSESIGLSTNDDGVEHDFPNQTHWCRPEELIARDPRDEHLPWTVRRDPWPFHVRQKGIGDCWLVSALKTITRKSELMNQILPRNDEAAKWGIYQVVLCVDGEWKVIVIDDFFPCDVNQREVFTVSFEKQLFPAIIQKAMAKLKGSYGKIDGGWPNRALEMFTGSFCRKLYLKDLTEEGLWTELVKASAACFPMAAATACKNPEEIKAIGDVGLQPNHCYALMAASVQNGHRLVQLHNPGPLKWEGKWSKWPSWSPSITKLCEGLRLSVPGVFWMEIDDVFKWFDFVSICDYYPTLHEVRLEQQVVGKADVMKKAKILMIAVESPCEVAIGAWIKQTSVYLYNFLFNVHRATSNNRLGELVQSAWAEADKTQTELSLLEKGNYFVVFHQMECDKDFPGHESTHPLTWVIRSTIPVHVGFTSTYRFMKCESLQKMIEKLGSVEASGETDGVTVWKWYTKYYLLVMAENRNTRKYAQVTVTHQRTGDNWTRSKPEVAPMTRRIVYSFRSYEENIRDLKLTIKTTTSYFSRSPIRAFCQVYAALPISTA